MLCQQLSKEVHMCDLGQIGIFDKSSLIQCEGFSGIHSCLIQIQENQG